MFLLKILPLEIVKVWTIEGSSKMSDSDIEEAIKQAKMYESQDQVTKR